MVKEGKLTRRQKEILEYIKKFSAHKKYPPSIREIASNFDLSSPATAHVHVQKLIEKGYSKRDAIKEVSDRYNVSKNKLYNEYKED